MIICTFTIPYSLSPGMLSFARLKDIRIRKKKLTKNMNVLYTGTYWQY